MLGEGEPHVGGRAVAVVGQRLDQDRRAAGPVALEADRLDRRRVGARAGAAVDRPLDVFLGHRGVFGLLHRGRQSRVAVDVAAAVAGGDDDRARQLREELAAFGVGGALLVFDRRPLRMTRHACHSMSTAMATDTHSHSVGKSARREPDLRRHAARGPLALDGAAADLALHRLQGLENPVPGRGALRGGDRRPDRLDRDRRLADQPPQPPLHGNHRHQPPGADAPLLDAQHARHDGAGRATRPSSRRS